jgi:hypothetical protein
MNTLRELVKLHPSATSHSAWAVKAYGQKHEESWDDFIYKLMVNSTISSFSEYEALGSFMYANHNEDLKLLVNNKWLRHGKTYFGNATLFRILMPILRMNNNFISFKS